ncbi:MAG: GNAT family N-acetyltransferase [Actinomycetota bacterium]
MTETVPEPQIAWREPFTNEEIHRLHAAAFQTRLFTAEEWDWVDLVKKHSFGWVTARLTGELVGFANVITDGFAHAWLQDVMVLPNHQRSGIGVLVVDRATAEAARTECEWLHVDFDDDVADFYYRRLGFQKTNGGLKYLQ